MDFSHKQPSYLHPRSLIGIPKPVLVSLLFYIGTLTATQTIYGQQFMALRWVALGSFTLVSFIYWLFGRIPQKDPMDKRADLVIVFIYLGATLLSVATAESIQFSGLKWATQGMLILSCMVFLRGTFNPEKMRNLLGFLKILSLALLLISLLFPAPVRVFDNPYFRGAMGDANSLGHVAAICALVLLQGALTTGKRSWKLGQLAVAAFAFMVLIRSGARSSAAAFLVGLMLINFYFSLTRSLLAKAATFLLVALILASPMIHSQVMSFLAKEERRFDYSSLSAPLREADKKGLLPSYMFATRERLWSEAWEGFMRRPFLGWGFGANADIAREWFISPTGAGMTRDITNDLLFVLEGSGLIGFLAYLGLIFFILKQFPSRQQILRLRQEFRKGIRDEMTLSRAYVHSQFYILSVSLFALFFFDGSAFSAGSLISAIFWISAGAANLTRMKTIKNEWMNHQIPKEFKGSSEKKKIRET